MAEEGSGQYVQVEHQSNAGKWILIVVAILAVAGFAYAQYMSHLQIQALSQGLGASQAQVKELQNRMQTAEAQEETLAREAGMTKKQLAQRAAALAGRTEGLGEPDRARAEGSDQRRQRRNHGREDRRWRSANRRSLNQSRS